MAVTGAFRVLSRLPADKAGANLALPSALVTNTTRAGWALKAVGGSTDKSHSVRRVLSDTGLSVNT